MHHAGISSLAAFIYQKISNAKDNSILTTGEGEKSGNTRTDEIVHIYNTLHSCIIHFIISRKHTHRLEVSHTVTLSLYNIRARAHQKTMPFSRALVAFVGDVQRRNTDLDSPLRSLASLCVAEFWKERSR